MNKPYQYFLISLAGVAVLVGASVTSFYGGMQYQQRQRMQVVGEAFGRMNGEGRRADLRPRVNGAGSGMGMPTAAGEVVSQDEKSMTVKMLNGSTRIVVLSEKTAFHTVTETKKDEIKVGKHVRVTGTTNADGSVTAEDIIVGIQE